MKYNEAVQLYVPFNPASPLLSAGAATSDIVAHCRAACIRLSAEHEHSLRAHTELRTRAWQSLTTDRTFCVARAGGLEEKLCSVADLRTAGEAETSCSAKMTHTRADLITKTHVTG